MLRQELRDALKEFEAILFRQEYQGKKIKDGQLATRLAVQSMFKIINLLERNGFSRIDRFRGYVSELRSILYAPKDVYSNVAEHLVLSEFYAYISSAYEYARKGLPLKNRSYYRLKALPMLYYLGIIYKEDFDDEEEVFRKRLQKALIETIPRPLPKPEK